MRVGFSFLNNIMGFLGGGRSKFSDRNHVDAPSCLAHSATPVDAGNASDHSSANLTDDHHKQRLKLNNPPEPNSLITNVNPNASQSRQTPQVNDTRLSLSSVNGNDTRRQLTCHARRNCRVNSGTNIDEKNCHPDMQNSSSSYLTNDLDEGISDEEDEDGETIPEAIPLGKPLPSASAALLKPKPVTPYCINKDNPFQTENNVNTVSLSLSSSSASSKIFATKSQTGIETENEPETKSHTQLGSKDGYFDSSLVEGVKNSTSKLQANLSEQVNYKTNKLTKWMDTNKKRHFDPLKFSKTKNTGDTFSTSCKTDAKAKPQPGKSSLFFKPRASFCGILNLGNTCYMASVIQALRVLDSFRFCLSSYTLQNMPSISSFQIERRSQFMSQLIHLLDQIDCIEEKESKIFPDTTTDVLAVNPSILKKELAKSSPAFDNSFQHDAQEFLLYVLDDLEQAQKSFLSNIGAQCPTAFHDLMTTSLVTETSCCVCKHRTVHESLNTMLTLHFPDEEQGLSNKSYGYDSRMYSLVTLLDNLFEDEDLVGSNQRKCDTCDAYQDASHRTRIRRAPNVLTLHLNRCTRPGFKTRAAVSAPSTLRLKHSWLEDSETYNEEPLPCFKLQSVVFHSGLSAASGHYFAVVRNPRFKNPTQVMINNSRATSGNLMDPLTYDTTGIQDPSGASASFQVSNKIPRSKTPSPKRPPVVIYLGTPPESYPETPLSTSPSNTTSTNVKIKKAFPEPETQDDITMTTVKTDVFVSAKKSDCSEATTPRSNCKRLSHEVPVSASASPGSASTPTKTKRDKKMILQDKSSTINFFGAIQGSSENIMLDATPLGRCVADEELAALSPQRDQYPKSCPPFSRKPIQRSYAESSSQTLDQKDNISNKLKGGSPMSQALLSSALISLPHTHCASHTNKISTNCIPDYHLLSNSDVQSNKDVTSRSGTSPPVAFSQQAVKHEMNNHQHKKTTSLDNLLKKSRRSLTTASTENPDQMWVSLNDSDATYLSQAELDNWMCKRGTYADTYLFFYERV